jgi:hypothetical protein
VELHPELTINVTVGNCTVVLVLQVALTSPLAANEASSNTLSIVCARLVTIIQARCGHAVKVSTVEVCATV